MPTGFDVRNNFQFLTYKYHRRRSPLTNRLCFDHLRNIGWGHVFFPVNTLRNIALDMAVTSHVFLTDVDFIPDQNLYENALQQLHSLQVMQSLVIPAFEMIEMKDLVRKEDLPSGKPELLNWWQKGIVQPFHVVGPYRGDALATRCSGISGQLQRVHKRVVNHAFSFRTPNNVLTRDM
ncbi:hypothetical protein CAPTEDRAFT_200999 [Capitella teleta]|uniref:Uncharacterized protein n=1 Tax=Capitella teleta TaxID=283909 RepID=R7T3B1_CAPTE|nr:hypothetical protein CAPTEDRAFT_200999 [Capitella teleta]|eukprot:ELT87167.1 hypothetical protein CAPTEDRAFT_200999 [Capitella teleta]